MRAAAEATEEPAGYPRKAERDVRIRDGQLVHLRPVRPGDAAMLVAFHASLSPRSVYLRFFGFHRVLTAREVERFTHVDYVDRFALVVLARGVLVAVGRYDRISGSDEAEVAFVVQDEHQRLGIGTLLADELARAARVQRIRSLAAETLEENVAMIETLRATGFPVESRFADGVVKLRLSIELGPAYLDALARREAARLVDPADGAGATC